jgi:hypothetical protein
MSPLGQKMIKTRELRNLARETQRGYVSAVKGLAQHYHQSPESLTKGEIEDYLLYLKNEKGNTTGSCGAVAAGLRFLYTHVVEQLIPFDCTRLTTTMIYLHVSRATLSKIPSPLDLFDPQSAKREDPSNEPSD